MIRSSVLMFMAIVFCFLPVMAQVSEPPVETPPFEVPMVGVEPLSSDRPQFDDEVVAVETDVLVCEDEKKFVEVTIREQTLRFQEGAEPYLPRHAIQLKVGGVLASQMTPACNGVCQPGQHCAGTVGEDRYVVYPNRMNEGFKGGSSVISWKKNEQAQHIPVKCRKI